MRHGLFALAGLVAGATVAGCSGGSTSTIPSMPIAQEPASQQRSVPAQDPTLDTAAPFATAKPTAKPTSKPTAAPTAKPTAAPTAKPTAKPTATPTPKPTATPPPVYPLKSGDTFSYQYTQSTTGKGTFTGVLTAVLSGPSNYNGASAFTLRTTGATASKNASLDHSDYINLVSSGGHTEFVEYGYNYAAQINYGNSVTEHDSTILTYVTPFISDTLPESNGASWSEPVAINETIHDYDTTSDNSPNILSGQLVRASDGSYHASGMNYDVPETRLVRSNGTGEIVDGPPSGATDWSYGLPVVKSGHEVIPATESYAGMSGTNFVPDWYPGGKLPANPLATASMRDLGAVKAPSQCGKRAGTTATHLQSLFSQLDPAVGFTNTELRDDYVVPGMGYICRLDAIVQKNFNTENTGALQSTITTNSTQVLVSETLK